MLSERRLSQDLPRPPDPLTGGVCGEAGMLAREAQGGGREAEHKGLGDEHCNPPADASAQQALTSQTNDSLR